LCNGGFIACCTMHHFSYSFDVVALWLLKLFIWCCTITSLADWSVYSFDATPCINYILKGDISFMWFVCTFGLHATPQSNIRWEHETPPAQGAIHKTRFLKVNKVSPSSFLHISWGMLLKLVYGQGAIRYIKCNTCTLLLIGYIME
jgi:hypothetical protein